MRDGQGVVVQSVGDVDASLRGGRVVSAEYRSPLAAHAHLEPQAALADVRPDRVTVWAATQNPGQVRDAVARALGRNPETIEVHTTYLGGSFGAKAVGSVAVEAAQLSASAGRPVHVGWNRGEEFQHSPLRPPTHHRLRATLDDGGRIVALEHHQASGDVLFVELPVIASAVLGADLGAYHAAFIRYNIPHRRTLSQRVQLPVRTTAWRGLGLLPNTFAIESFMDELAHVVGEDPLRFRLRHLADDELGTRLGRVLQTAADRASWGAPARVGRARAGVRRRW